MLGFFASEYTWLDWTIAFQDNVKGVIKYTRTQVYVDHTVRCISSIPENVDPDIVPG